eukprot:jgi/Tetstr1/446841/TSEL_034320.t1
MARGAAYLRLTLLAAMAATSLLAPTAVDGDLLHEIGDLLDRSSRLPLQQARMDDSLQDDAASLPDSEDGSSAAEVRPAAAEMGRGRAGAGRVVRAAGKGDASARIAQLTEQYPGLFRYYRPVKKPRKGWLEAVHNRQYMLVTDSKANFYPSPSGVSTVICLNAKVGSSRWKALLLRAKGIDAPVARAVHHTTAPWLKALRGVRAHGAKVADPRKLRFMFVRNPYARLLSGFLDKGVNWVTRMKAEYRGPYKATPAEFRRFVGVLLARRGRSVSIDPHFELLTRGCGMPHGYAYHFYLKVDEMDVWYADFIALLGLGEAAAAGWAPETSSPGKQLPDCFLPLPGRTCAETTAAIANHDALVANASSASGAAAPAGASWMQVRTSDHSHGADRQMREYYADPRTRAMAQRFLARDIAAFGYPRLPLESGELPLGGKQGKAL